MGQLTSELLKTWVWDSTEQARHGWLLIRALEILLPTDLRTYLLTYLLTIQGLMNITESYSQTVAPKYRLLQERIRIVSAELLSPKKRAPNIHSWTIQSKRVYSVHCSVFDRRPVGWLISSHEPWKVCGSEEHSDGRWLGLHSLHDLAHVILTNELVYTRTPMR